MSLAAHVNQHVPSPRAAWAAATSNKNGVIFPSEARAENTAYTSDPIQNPGARGVRLFITNGTIGTTTLTVKIQVQNPLDDTWADLPLAVTAALSTDNSTQILTVYPGIGAVANTDISQHLGPVWRVVATLNDGDTTPVTFGVGASYLF